MTSEEEGQKREPGDIVGDYRLVELVSRGEGTRTWRAEQISIQRPVMLEILKQEWSQDFEVREAFLADVRAKAAINHPVIGHVYEAQSDDMGTYLAREVLDGSSLEDLHEVGKKFSPREVATQIESIASAYLHLEQLGIATVGLAAHHLVLSDKTNEIRLMNLAVDGEVILAQGTCDKQLLGELYEDLLAKEQSGSVRTSSLLDYMADVSRPVPLTWDQINRLAKQVREELTDTEVLQEVVNEEKKAARFRSRSANIWALLGGLGLILALFFFFIRGGEDLPEEEKTVEPPADLPPVAISARGARFKMAPHEVTIAQYARFLKVLERIPDSQKHLYDHEEQPAGKADHLPTDWETMLNAAKTKSAWSGRSMSENCPVVGVDFWDAYAYSQWEETRLPTTKEWLAAAATGTPSEGVSAWGDATVSTKDRTGLGLIGMAGNVSEWTSDLERNPAFPLNAKQPLACGGSFQNPAAGAKTRVFLKNREVRRNDLGFRTVK